MRFVPRVGRGIQLSLLFGLALACVATHKLFAQPKAKPSASHPSGEWVAYGHDALGSRFSPLAQITKDNVAQLTVAWTYRTGEASVATKQTTKFEATPLMVDGTLFLSTPFGQVMALDPDSVIGGYRLQDGTLPDSVLSD